jgi:pfkB family carbohydrate kinase
VVRRSLLDDCAAIHEHHLARRIAGKAHFMRHDDHGEPAFGKVAHDGEHLLNKLGIEGGCRLIEQHHSYRVDYCADGERTWTPHFTETDFDVLSPDVTDIPARYRDAAGFLVLAMTLTGQERLVAWARRETRALIALDPREDYIFGNEERLMALIGRTDVFLPSAEEVRRLLGHEDWVAAARSFAEKGAALVVIKLGSGGAVAYSRDRDSAIHCPAMATDAVDTTGAGDSFCGAMIARLLQVPEDLEGALRAGTVAASLAIRDFGTEPLFAAKPEDVRVLWQDFLSAP